MKFHRFIGVSDIANVRFSLPAQLLEPTPNLEYWNYLDQPSTFIAIGDSDDALDRMLEVLRFWFTKVWIFEAGDSKEWSIAYSTHTKEGADEFPGPQICQRETL